MRFPIVWSPFSGLYLPFLYFGPLLGKGNQNKAAEESR